MKTFANNGEVRILVSNYVSLVLNRQLLPFDFVVLIITKLLQQLLLNARHGSEGESLPCETIIRNFFNVNHDDCFCNFKIRCELPIYTKRKTWCTVYFDSSAANLEDLVRVECDGDTSLLGFVARNHSSPFVLFETYSRNSEDRILSFDIDPPKSVAQPIDFSRKSKSYTSIFPCIEHLLYATLFHLDDRSLVRQSSTSAAASPSAPNEPATSPRRHRPAVSSPSSAADTRQRDIETATQLCAIRQIFPAYMDLAPFQSSDCQSSLLMLHDTVQTAQFGMSQAAETAGAAIQAEFDADERGCIESIGDNPEVHAAMIECGILDANGNRVHTNRQRELECFDDYVAKHTIIPSAGAAPTFDQRCALKMYSVRCQQLQSMRHAIEYMNDAFLQREVVVENTTFVESIAENAQQISPFIATSMGKNFANQLLLRLSVLRDQFNINNNTDASSSIITRQQHLYRFLSSSEFLCLVRDLQAALKRTKTASSIKIPSTTSGDESSPTASKSKTANMFSGILYLTTEVFHLFFPQTPAGQKQDRAPIVRRMRNVLRFIHRCGSITTPFLQQIDEFVDNNNINNTNNNTNNKSANSALSADDDNTNNYNSNNINRWGAIPMIQNLQQLEDAITSEIRSFHENGIFDEENLLRHESADDEAMLNRIDTALPDERYFHTHISHEISADAHLQHSPQAATLLSIIQDGADAKHHNSNSNNNNNNNSNPNGSNQNNNHINNSNNNSSNSNNRSNDDDDDNNNNNNNSNNNNNNNANNNDDDPPFGDVRDIDFGGDDFDDGDGDDGDDGGDGGDGDVDDFGDGDDHNNNNNINNNNNNPNAHAPALHLRLDPIVDRTVRNHRRAAAPRPAIAVEDFPIPLDAARNNFMRTSISQSLPPSYCCCCGGQTYDRLQLVDSSRLVNGIAQQPMGDSDIINCPRSTDLRARGVVVLDPECAASLLNDCRGDAHNVSSVHKQAICVLPLVRSLLRGRDSDVFNEKIVNVAATTALRLRLRPANPELHEARPTCEDLRTRWGFLVNQNAQCPRRTQPAGFIRRPPAVANAAAAAVPASSTKNPRGNSAFFAWYNPPSDSDIALHKSVNRNLYTDIITRSGQFSRLSFDDLRLFVNYINGLTASAQPPAFDFGNSPVWLEDRQNDIIFVEPIVLCGQIPLCPNCVKKYAPSSTAVVASANRADADLVDYLFLPRCMQLLQHHEVSEILLSVVGIVCQSSTVAVKDAVMNEATGDGKRHIVLTRIESSCVPYLNDNGFVIGRAKEMLDIALSHHYVNIHVEKHKYIDPTDPKQRLLLLDTFNASRKYTDLDLVVRGARFLSSVNPWYDSGAYRTDVEHHNMHKLIFEQIATKPNNFDEENARGGTTIPASGNPVENTNNNNNNNININNSGSPSIPNPEVTINMNKKTVVASSSTEARIFAHHDLTPARSMAVNILASEMKNQASLLSHHHERVTTVNNKNNLELGGSINNNSTSNNNNNNTTANGDDVLRRIMAGAGDFAELFPRAESASSSDDGSSDIQDAIQRMQNNRPTDGNNNNNNNNTRIAEDAALDASPSNVPYVIVVNGFPINPDSSWHDDDGAMGPSRANVVHSQHTGKIVLLNDEHGATFAAYREIQESDGKPCIRALVWESGRLQLQEIPDVLLR
ncbi:MAG: hypothetical protein ABL959_07975, partial [Pyrinomonadaceae bacterium]